jgi:hypothetical protein
VPTRLSRIPRAERDTGIEQGDLQPQPVGIGEGNAG